MRLRIVLLLFIIPYVLFGSKSFVVLHSCLKHEQTQMECSSDCCQSPQSDCCVDDIVLLDTDLEQAVESEIAAFASDFWVPERLGYFEPVLLFEATRPTLDEKNPPLSKPPLWLLYQKCLYYDC